MQETSSLSASISNFSPTRRSFKPAVFVCMVMALITLFPSNSTAQTPFLRELEDKAITTFEDGCRSIAAFLRLPVATGTFEQVLEELRKREIVRNKWAKADEPLTWGRISYMMCRALDIRGGLIMTATRRTTERYALRECLDRGLVPRQGNKVRYLSGADLMAVLYRMEVYVKSR